jgi:hypothetical protein
MNSFPGHVPADVLLHLDNFHNVTHAGEGQRSAASGWDQEEKRMDSGNTCRSNESEGDNVCRAESGGRMRHGALPKIEGSVRAMPRAERLMDEED